MTLLQNKTNTAPNPTRRGVEASVLHIVQIGIYVRLRVCDSKGSSLTIGEKQEKKRWR
jgi:hypothetical protein